MDFDIIIGAGISGCSLARLLAERNRKVLIIEKREHIGGNCYDSFDKNGVLIHDYGPHIFHTSHKKVWHFLNRFTRFNDYSHKVLAYVSGKLLPLPFNFNSIKKCKWQVKFPICWQLIFPIRNKKIL